MMRFDDLVTANLRKRMVEIARELRKEPTDSEAILWDALRGRQLDGYKFRRQQPIGAFVVDFYCDEAALVVEVDGPIHRQQRAADRERDEILGSLGLRVLRLPAEVVEMDIPMALEQIKRRLHRDSRPLSRRERGDPSARRKGRVEGASERAVCG
jgi:very-short-patch-repair endonuclease